MLTVNSAQINTLAGDICRIGVKAPAFSKRDPDLYFIQMESQFRNAGVTTDQTKYDHVVGSLDSNTLRNIADIIRAPPAVNKYEAVKRRLIQDFVDSENRKLRRLMQECQLGDHKPSHLLRTMRDLSSGTMNDGAIKQLWLDRLPEAVRAVVSISDVDLDKCAQQADIMLEMGNYNSVSEVHTSERNLGNNPAVSSSFYVKHLVNAVEELSKQFRDSKVSQHQFRSRRRSNTPARTQHSRTRPENLVLKYPVCFYHHRFGASARKCAKPCSFTTMEN
ncbi:uncharacterized protein LOC119665887 [Teleopsis dalmanni]|uniref:uncharacterized protein LOC119665887 n=1 Tax=Teleopsis dalmanni TaxID=139649 RepID=UPI0018CCDAFD|nr:uncharacterized protein LOC119665887 [Teleopsis dalmanni]